MGSVVLSVAERGHRRRWRAWWRGHGEEGIQPYERPRVFNETTTVSTDLSGQGDCLISESGTVPTTPYLCVSEAKKDDVDKGLAQCLVEMQACAGINARTGKEIPLHGVVTNGSGWQFYRREPTGEVLERAFYASRQPDEILGKLDAIFSSCQANR